MIFLVGYNDNKTSYVLKHWMLSLFYYFSVCVISVFGDDAMLYVIYISSDVFVTMQILKQLSLIMQRQDFMRIMRCSSIIICSLDVSSPIELIV